MGWRNTPLKKALLTEDVEVKFTALMNDNMDFAYNTAKRFLTDPDDIQDAIQYAFIKAWKSFQQFDPKKSAFTTWFYTILKNQCLDRVRQLKHSKTGSLIEESEAQSSDFSEKIEQRELIEEIIKHSEKLPPNQRDTFLLRDIHGYNVREVAEQTGQSEGSVKTNLYLARKKIKQWLIHQNII